MGGADVCQISGALDVCMHVQEVDEECCQMTRIQKQSKDFPYTVRVRI